MPIDSRIHPTASGELVASPGRPCEAGGETKRFQFCPAKKWTQKSRKGRANLLNFPACSKLESSASSREFLFSSECILPTFGRPFSSFSGAACSTPRDARTTAAGIDPPGAAAAGPGAPHPPPARPRPRARPPRAGKTYPAPREAAPPPELQLINPQFATAASVTLCGNGFVFVFVFVSIN